MKRMTVIGLSLMAVLSVSAAIASTASAKVVLTIKTAKGPLVSGQEVKAFSSDLVFVTEAGTLECTSNTLEGTLTVNGAAKDKGTVTKEISKGEEVGEACKTSGLGPAAIVSSGFPWPVEFTTKGTASVKGSKKVTFTSTFLAIPGEPKCTFESSKVASTFNTTGVITDTVTKQVFKKNKKTSASICPATGELSGHFSFSSEGEPAEAEL